jgi:hypothetical protein
MRGRRIWLVLAVLLVALSIVSTPAEATRRTTRQDAPTEGGAEEPPPTTPPPEPPTPVGDGLPHVVLRQQDPFVSPHGLLSMTLELQNAPPDALIWFSVRGSLTNNTDQRDLFDSMIAGKKRTDVVWPGTPFPVSLFARNADQTINADLPISSDANDTSALFTIEDPGVYPVDVALLTGDRREVDKFTTFMVKLPPASTEGPSIEVATVVPFHAPLSRQPDGSTQIAPDRREHLDRITKILAKHPNLPFTFNPTPETIEAMHRTDPAAPTTKDIADAIRGREVLSSTFVDLDLDAWVASKLTSALSDQLTLGADVLRAHLNPSPPAERRTWQADSTLTPTALSQLRQFGVDQVVVPEASVAPLDRAVFDAKQMQLASMQPFEIENSEGGRMRAFAADTKLVSRLTATDNPVLNAQYAITDLAILYFGARSPSFRNPEVKKRGVVLAVPDDPAVLPALDAFLDQLGTKVDPAGGGRSILQPATLEEAFAIERASTPKTNQPVVRSYTPTGTTRQSMGDFPTQLAEAHHLIEGFRSMVAKTAPDRVTALDELIQVPGAAGLTDEQRQAYFDVLQGEVRAAREGVSTPGQEQVTLTSTEAQLPIRLENALPYAVDVRVLLTSEKLDFTDGNNIVATLQPGVNKIPINVRAKASGLITLDIKVLSPDSGLDLVATRFSVRSTAVSGLGLALTIGSGFFLLLWWARHWRSSRRARNLVGADRTDRPAASSTASGARGSATGVGDLAEPAGGSAAVGATEATGDRTPSTRSMT